MAVKKRSHSEQRWALLPPGVVRCEGHLHSGTRCRREAEPGSVVCDQHGGAAPQVRRRALERTMNAADRAVQFLIDLMDDETAPVAERAKAARDLADRAGLAAAQTLRVIPDAEDPVEKLFAELLADPTNFESIDAKADVIDAEVIEDADAAQIEWDAVQESRLPDADVLPLVPRHYGSTTDQHPAGCGRTPKHIAEGLRRLDERR